MYDLMVKFAEELARKPLLITACGAILAAIVSAMVAYWVARRSVYINSVTAERSKWIEALRGTISKFSGAAGRVSARQSHDDYVGKEDQADDLEKLQVLLTDLTLRLIPGEKEACNLLYAARKLDMAARLHTPTDTALANSVMIGHAQWVAKTEWERVKWEASGLLARLVLGIHGLWRGRKYKTFLKAEGALTQLDKIGAVKPSQGLGQALASPTDAAKT